MTDVDNQLPAPPFHHVVELAPPGAPDEVLMAQTRSLPAAAGVIALEDEEGRTITLATTTDIRRQARSRLLPPADDPDGTSARRADLRSLARRALAIEVGSPFEADWVYLQHARRRLPHAYRAVLDRWQGWFVHVDPAARFPRLTKTAAPTPSSGVHLGPVADKHAAARYIELLESLFDLCRYHHILVQSPNATACAYKEMGRCPAPCDGSITLEQYRAMIDDAISFATEPVEERRTQWAQAMREAGKALEFERAERLKRRLDELEAAKKRAFAHVRAIESFRFVALQRSNKASFIRLFLINGGWIAPYCDVPTEASTQQWQEVADSVNTRCAVQAPVLDSPAALEHLAVTCRHLFTKPRTPSTGGQFLACENAIDARQLRAAVRALVKQTQDPITVIDEHEMELGDDTVG